MNTLNISFLRSIKENSSAITGYFTDYNSQNYYCIENVDSIPTFFITLTSPSNHWMFLSSNGGITAGRTDRENALFPYYTEDKIMDNRENTGGLTLIKIQTDKGESLWKPFDTSPFKPYLTKRNLLKNNNGNSIIFQEIRKDLDLAFEEEWTSSPKWGIMRFSRLYNFSDRDQKFEILDGVRNILPPKATTLVQNTMSNLLDAYKRNELEAQGNIGIFSFSATLTDKALPNEALLAATWWQEGISDGKYLLSEQQISDFLQGHSIAQENDIKGCRGAYFVSGKIELPAHSEKEWYFCGETNQDHSKLDTLIDQLSYNRKDFLKDILRNQRQAHSELDKKISRCDGLQQTGNSMHCIHHKSNILFNIMRGGYPANGYLLKTSDLAIYIEKTNSAAYSSIENFLKEQEDYISLFEWKKILKTIENRHAKRLIQEYLPITFSRRHGDPSRPWNFFSIETENPDGSEKIDYQGNWRDIFQNWEAMLISYPEFSLPVIRKFLNATSADGYNAYRINKFGVDWEKPEPQNPWSNIGYWSDHQIIYLLKLLELTENYFPGSLKEQFTKEEFVHVEIPYRIKSYKHLRRDPRNSIEFDYTRDKELEEGSRTTGSDAKLLQVNNTILYSSMVEKILILILAKVSNLVPDGGIWMNTQRPEWNDANNALVGYGLSMVTLNYLYRFVVFLKEKLKELRSPVPLLNEVKDWLHAQSAILTNHEEDINRGISPTERSAFMDSMGESASKYREKLYEKKISGEKSLLSIEDIIDYLSHLKRVLKKSLSTSIRPDGMTHSYNRLVLTSNEAHIEHYYEMLEGQVAAISSGAWNSDEILEILTALRNSKIYLEDQKTYMLYPNRQIPGFIEKNRITRSQMNEYPEVAQLADRVLSEFLSTSNEKVYHFKSSFKNAYLLKEAIANHRDEFKISPNAELQLLELYEKTFHHRDFTGRSGTFFGYEGLGSIYWHMVSKLLLAVQEAIFRERNPLKQEQIIKIYFTTRDGLGYKKTVEQYGAFPFDPYSHTPYMRGAKQPGMTGQVKEEILTRLGELGLIVKNGILEFTPLLVNTEEFLAKKTTWRYYDTQDDVHEVVLEAGTYGFTFCQVPIIVSRGKSQIRITHTDNSKECIENLCCTKEISRAIFSRSSSIKLIEVSLEL